MRRCIVMLVLAGAAVPTMAAPPADSVQAAAGSVALDPAAIRFTAIRPQGRGATVYQAGRGANGAERTIIDLSPMAGGGWTVDSRETRPLAGETLDYFTGRIDAAIAAGGGGGVGAGGDCPDEPAYYAEHGANGTGGGCGTGQPNAAIARALGLADPLAP